MTTPHTRQRDTYVDFLRGFGLLLLVVAHTFAPAWLAAVRTFDVPLMVFVSAICFHPPRGGYGEYVVKRVRRIYVPVFIFLTLLFLFEFCCFLAVGRPRLDPLKVVGSYFMLNEPLSVGYVWVMRVFLLMALLMPLWHRVLHKATPAAVGVTAAALVVAQQGLVMWAATTSGVTRFIFDQLILDAVGYSAVAVAGLCVGRMSRRACLWLTLAAAAATLVCIWTEGMVFDPQASKYPPHGLYLVYGLACSLLLWWLRPALSPLLRQKFWLWLSEKSMWLYLWHIVPAMMIYPWRDAPGMWGVRYCFVLVVAVLLCIAYHRLCRLFPQPVRSWLE